MYPAVAVLVTFPLAALHYRRWGRVHPWRAVVLYAFVFYLLASLFLVLLPLPDLPAKGTDPALWEERFGRLRSPELDPTASIRDIVTAPTATLRSKALFQVLFNLALLAPLGGFLRWLFGRRPVVAALVGFLVSLTFEVCQLTGIFWIYPGPFRLFDTGDLVLNAIGCVAAAAAVSPLVSRGILPDLYAPPRPAGEWIGVVRRSLAFGIDFVAFASSVLLLVELADALGAGSRLTLYAAPALLFMVWFIVVPAATGGEGLGKHLMLCRISTGDGGPAGTMRLVVRQVALWMAPALIWASDGWWPGRAVAPTPLGLAVALWCTAWTVNAASVLPSRQRAGLLDKALHLRVRNTWDPAAAGAVEAPAPRPRPEASRHVA
ncbi:MAG: VanZ family protein [Acidimicrobiales bacterium]